MFLQSQRRRHSTSLVLEVPFFDITTMFAESLFLVYSSFFYNEILLMGKIQKWFAGFTLYFNIFAGSMDAVYVNLLLMTSL